jgi:hypothetical protein
MTHHKECGIHPTPHPTGHAPEKTPSDPETPAAAGEPTIPAAKRPASPVLPVALPPPAPSSVFRLHVAAATRHRRPRLVRALSLPPPPSRLLLLLTDVTFFGR